MTVHRLVAGAFLITLVPAGCGDDSTEGGGSGTETETEGTGGTASTASGTDSTTAGATDSGTSVGSASASGGSSGGATGSGSASASGGTGSTGGTTGGATCPGTQTGCVVDWAGAFQQQGATDGVGTAARFNFISGITSAGNFVYVSDNHAVRRIDMDDATVTTFAGALGQTGYVDDVGTAARFNRTVGIATDGTYLWVADADNFVIRQIEIASATVTTIAGNQGTAGSADGMGASATFDNMRDLAWDGAHLFHVQANAAIRRIDVGTGAVITVAGTAGQTGFADGVGAAARFDAPRFVEPIATGELYISDTENHRPRLMVVNGGVGTVSSPYGGAAGYMDGNGAAALFRRQRGLAHDGSGTLTVADSDNFVIREIDLGTADVTTIAGMAGTNTHVEGLGTAAGFDKPLDMHHDASTGDLFISEGAVLRRMYYQ